MKQLGAYLFALILLAGVTFCDVIGVFHFLGLLPRYYGAASWVACVAVTIILALALYRPRLTVQKRGVDAIPFWLPILVSFLWSSAYQFVGLVGLDWLTHRTTHQVDYGTDAAIAVGFAAYRAFVKVRKGSKPS